MTTLNLFALTGILFVAACAAIHRNDFYEKVGRNSRHSLPPKDRLRLEVKADSWQITAVILTVSTLFVAVVAIASAFS